MPNTILKIGCQIRELCDDFNGKRIFNRFGYLVDFSEDGFFSVLWTHDSLGLPIADASRENERNLWPTGKKYSA